jgi:hypothetical protein
MKADSELAAKRTWRDLYLAALFEPDPAKLLERIAEAEYVLNLRERALWYSGGDHTKEKLALTGAMRALEALRNIHQYPRPVASPAARQETASIGEVGKSAGSIGPKVQGGGGC